MGRRGAGHIRLVVLLGLLPCLGCALPTMTSPLAPLAPVTAKLTSSSSAKPAPSDLPPSQAADLCVTLARSLEREGHDVEAIGQYGLARHYKPDVDVARRLAVLYDRVGDASRAMPEYERALKEHPRDADLLNDLGYHHYNLGRWAEAEKSLRQALEINSRHANAWTNLGMTLAQEGRCKESVEAFQHCVGQAEAECNLAFLLTTQGKREDARAAYKEALRLQPGMRLAQTALTKLDDPPHPPALPYPSPGQPTGRPAGNAVAAATPGAARGGERKGFAPPASAPEMIRTSATVADASPEAPPPEPSPTAKDTSGWLIPGRRSDPVATAPPAPCSGSASPVDAGAPALRWLPPPPVPQPTLPADLQPAARAATSSTSAAH
jgi:hypothetical protein